MYMDDIKLFAKNEKELETLTQTVIICSQDIGMDFWHRKMHHTDKEKWQSTRDRRNRTTKPRKITLGEKETCK